ncbi:ESX secretion-associated protein EspG [Saccharopolyspora sp. NPDC050389]|uniref:ESX secretion-associated protein EspG n=1 Tax=Saccharopolyspora sp. NPDC050389 TaxID=3155516 RepID=UPI0033CB1A8A
MKIELSKQAFHEAWKHFKLGTKPLVLNVLPEGIRQSERREAERRAWDELRALGFGNEMREDDIYGVFLPLQRYERAFDVTFNERRPDGGKRVLSGLVANVRSNAALAVQTAESVRLVALPADSMVRAALSVLPDDLKAGPGRGVSLRSSAMEEASKAAGTSDRAMADGLARQGVRRDDARTLVEMAGGQRVAWAQFGASIMDGQGKRHRAPMVTNFFANAKGWYFIENSHRSAEAWTTIAPADKQRMATRVQDLLKTL